MKNKKTNSIIPLFLIVLLLLLGSAILWLIVPTLAENRFGSSASNLSTVQKWQYGLQVLVHENDLTVPVSLIDQEIGFTIPSGASVTSVAMELQSAGLINNWQAFRYYVIYKGMDTGIKAGDFTLSPKMTAIQISDAIQSTYSAEVSFFIYPGWRAEEIAAALPTSGIEVSPETFLAVVANPGNLNLPPALQGIPSLEGFLYPGAYTINRQVTAVELAMIFVGRFLESINLDTQTEIQAQGLTLYEGIILASIIQRETFDDSERSLMASVFFNRLASGMKLETDPTVQYALGYSADWGGWWKTPLTLNDLTVQSDYNTYLIPGLPDRPISNPDLPSILAVARPAESNFYYFRAKCDGSGSHIFSQTYDEHLQNACQ